MADAVKALNGRGPAAKRARKLWWRRQLRAQGVYDGPLRLLGYLIALGVPLAAYSAIVQGHGGMWPYMAAGGALALVLSISYVRHRLAKNSARADARGPWYER